MVLIQILKNLFSLSKMNIENLTDGVQKGDLYGRLPRE
jgi:hypothetical protein